MMSIIKIYRCDKCGKLHYMMPYTSCIYYMRNGGYGRCKKTDKRCMRLCVDAILTT
jgi:hypothetical protein